MTAVITDENGVAISVLGSSTFATTLNGSATAVTFIERMVPVPISPGTTSDNGTEGGDNVNEGSFGEGQLAQASFGDIGSWWWFLLLILILLFVLWMISRRKSQQ